MYYLKVLTPEEVIFDDEVTAIIAPGALGYLGVLSNHAPLISTLKSGYLIITDKDKQKHYFEISGGFLEVSKNKAFLLADTIHKTTPVNMDGTI